MAKLFSKLTTEGTEKVEDRIGGGRQLFDTDVYEDIKLKLVYTGKWDSGAEYVVVIADIDGKEFEETITITNAKGENFYMKDGKKNQMPGFVTINELCLTVTGEELEDQDWEERQIEVWSSEDKKKVRQARFVATALTGAQASLAIRKLANWKQQKTDKKDDRGRTVYEDTDQVIESNDIAKSFHVETRCTVSEIQKAQKDEKEPVAEFIDKWKDQWAGKLIDQRKGTPKKGSGNAGAPKASSSGEAPKTSLFKKKD